MQNLGLTLKSTLLSSQAASIWIAFLITAVSCPILIKLSPEFGLFDNPEGSNRKIHGTAKPLGGPALALGIIPILVIFADNGAHLTVAALLVFFTGLIDDLKGLPARVKLLAQIAAVTYLLGTVSLQPPGILFSETGGLTLTGLPKLAFLGFWLVGGTNAFNLIDGLDGLSSGVAIISLSPLFLLTFGQPASFLLGGTIAALGAILLYNFYPARLFLGDGGSYLTGFLVSYLVITALSRPDVTPHFGWPLFAGIALMGVPVLDTLLAIGRRVTSHRGVMKADQEHLHHKLHRTFGHLPAVLIIYAISASFAVLAFHFYL